MGMTNDFEIAIEEGATMIRVVPQFLEKELNHNNVITVLDMMEQRKQVREALSYIRTKTKMKPEIGIVLGTGLGGLVKEIQKEVVLEYESIPHFPVSTVESHHGKLIFGTLGGKKIVAMQGRFHFMKATR